MIDTTEIFLAINSIRKNEKKKPSKSNIYQHLQKDEKHKELEYETFDQVIENLLLSGTIFTKTDPDSFYISNDDIIIESFNDITLLRQDINEKENKIRELNHRLEILSEVSELKLNDINNQITSIHTSLNNITSSHKAQNNCSKISFNQMFFLITRVFLLMKSWKIIIKITFRRINLKLPKDAHLKTAIKLRTTK